MKEIAGQYVRLKKDVAIGRQLITICAEHGPAGDTELFMSSNQTTCGHGEVITASSVIFTRRHHHHHQQQQQQHRSLTWKL